MPLGIETLQLIRNPKPDYTPGGFFFHEKFICYSLEDPVREHKIPGMTAIPEGIYPVTIWYSPTFKRMVPRLHNVPDFTDILIHPGNFLRDTRGCPLTGLRRVGRTVWYSVSALNRLMKTIAPIDHLQIEVKAE